MQSTRLRVAAGFAALALASGLVCATAALLAGPAYRIEWLALGAAFKLLRWATYGALAGAAVALAAEQAVRAILGFHHRPNRVCH